jgi:hypothetical protein
MRRRADTMIFENMLIGEYNHARKEYHGRNSVKKAWVRYPMSSNIANMITGPIPR